MNTQVRHWITGATALVATIGASLAIFLGPVPSEGGPDAASARSSLAAVGGDTSTRAAL
jgi:hypothetical protein